jgi:CheY-like chemotaxis protein
VVEVLQKPVDRAALLAVLRRCLPGNHPRILIVDDEEDARRVLASHLEDEPCEVRTAADGQQALEILEAWPPDLVLLDLVMPRLDGIAFLHHLRATPRFQFLPVVIVPARELPVAEGQQLRQMAQDIVKKGSDFEADLRRVLRRLLPPSSPEGEDPP